jgi:hypothetical protein
MRILVKLTLLLLRIASGFADATLPNIKNSVKDISKCPITKKNEYKLDWIRLITACITFVILVLNFLGYTDIAGFISQLFGIKGQ